MNLARFRMPGGVKVTALWITDGEVRSIFGATRCFYRTSNGIVKKEADGVFVREYRAKDGTLGYILKSPINGEKWLWLINKRTRRPHAVHPIH